MFGILVILVDILNKVYNDNKVIIVEFDTNDDTIYDLLPMMKINQVPYTFILQYASFL